MRFYFLAGLVALTDCGRDSSGKPAAALAPCQDEGEDLQRIARPAAPEKF